MREPRGAVRIDSGKDVYSGGEVEGGVGGKAVAGIKGAVGLGRLRGRPLWALFRGPEFVADR
jgi:hypothetical protein